MLADLYREMFELEENYWWHVAKRKLVRGLLAKEIGDFTDKVLVDVGCGTGKFIEEKGKWRKWKRVLGLDGAEEALEFCKRRGISDVRKADFEKKLKIRSNSVDVITSLDVVEHIEKDVQLLGEFYRILKPGGIVIVTVPAHGWLWTYWDEMLGHKRRYGRAELKRKFRKAGFRVEKSSFFYSYLLPVAVVFRLFRSRLPNQRRRSDFVRLPEPINKALILLAAAESRVAEVADLPLGLSIVCVGRKG